MAAAAECYRRALALKPDYPAALYNLGLVLGELGRTDEAERCFRRLTELDPGDAEALIQLGALLNERPAPSEARAVLGRAVRLRPDSPHAHYHLGLACKAAGDRRSAQEAFETALKLDRGAEPLSALGLLLIEEGRGAEAAGYLSEAVQLLPEQANLHNNLGSALRLAEQQGEAIQSFRRALELQPDLAEALLNLGDCHFERGEHAAAVECYASGARLHPPHSAFEGRLLFTMQQLCDWSRYEDLSARKIAALEQRPDEAGAPFSLLAIPSTARQQLACAQATARRLQRLSTQATPFRSSSTPEHPRRIRVGYLSGDYHEHVTAYVVAGLFEQHDRNSFELFGYSFGPDDGSALRTRIIGALEHFVDLARLPDGAAAGRIHADGVDILVDLNGYTLRARSAIAALRPAPIQVNYLGYPGTMGASFIDYIIVDRYVFRDEDTECFTEQPVFMPGCYAPSALQRDASPTPSRAQLGLPDEAFVFCCFNQAFKITREVFALWMRLLKAVSEAVLWLLEGNPTASANLRAQAVLESVEPSRLVFAPRVAPEAYLGRLPAADLFLDTWPYNAHTTAADALWAGVPVLTCSGDTFASRVAGSMLSAAGLPELIAPSPAGYEALALRLACDPARLAGIRGRLAASRASAPLFDMPRYACNLETAFRRMLERHRAGLPPRALEGRPCAAKGHLS